MASISFHFLLFCSFFLLHLSMSLSSALFLPLTKDPQTNEHLTQIFHTSQLLPINLVLDLNTPFLYLGISANNKSSAILRRSIKCSALGLDESEPSDEDCNFSLKSPITGETSVGKLVQDVIAFNNQFPVVDEFQHVFAPSILLTGLASSAKGVLGLGRNRVGVVEQVFHSFGFSKKFSICLSSSSNGMVIFGENHEIEVFKSMVYTPIVMVKNRDSYHINLNALKVQNKKLPLNQLSSIQFSTHSPYTLMESWIYKEIIKAFAIEIEIMGVIRVNPVGKFELCYSMEESKKVPVIDLVLQSEMVKWRIYGHNSMVKVNDGVMCLGILDGGKELVSSIVLGSHQLEDNLVEFDLGRSVVGFSSLVIKQNSCSKLSSSFGITVQSV